MTRNQKTGLFAGLAVVSFIVAGAVIYEMEAPRIARGVATPVTAVGWVQLVVSALAAAGFSSAGIWQAAASLIETRLPGMIHSDAPSISDATIKTSVDVSKIATIKGLISSTKDPATKAKYIDAARADFDNLRDDLFPVSSLPDGKS